MVGAGHEHVLDHIVLPERSAFHTSTAASLRAVELGLGALGVATRGDGDDDVFLGNEILVGDITVPGNKLRAPIVTKLLSDFVSSDDTMLRWRGSLDKMSL
jgi:hypothetical protein